MDQLAQSILYNQLYACLAIVKNVNDKTLHKSNTSYKMYYLSTVSNCIKVTNPQWPPKSLQHLQKTPNVKSQLHVRDTSAFYLTGIWTGPVAL